MKKFKFKETKIPVIFFTILPISIILGPSISLINTIFLSLLSLVFFQEYFKNKDNKLNDKNALIAFIVLYIYLILNSLVSIDYSSGAFRNIGFVRFILFF